MDILGKLFGSAARVKVLKLFLYNPEEVFESAEIIRKAKITSGEARREIVLMQTIGFVRKKSVYKEVLRKSRGRREMVKRRIQGYCLDENFPYINQLIELFRTDKNSNKMILRRLHTVGKLKLVITSGFLTDDQDGRVDLLIVGDSLKRAPLEQAIKSIEAEIGRELRYSAFETPEFQYRMSIYDRLVRDILDFPHTKLLDRLGME
jgi:hypothetical protein